MTMIGVGTPDFQKYAHWRGTPIQQANFGITSAATIDVKQYVTNWASINVDCQIATGVGCTLKVSFWTDQTETILVRTMKWAVVAGPCIVSVCIPVAANWMHITISTAQAGTQTGTITVVATNVPVARPTYQLIDANAHGLSVNINAGAALTTVFPQIVEGDAFVYVNCSAATAQYTPEINALNEAGVQYRQLLRLVAINGTTKERFLASPDPLQFKLTNNDAAAHTYTYNVQVIQP